ncbi:hypothetical protein EGW08_014044 [Elysia chlorotica]|uniref:Uncharacterized protein n=1 Tax=Elysia chlorotica TaxID=188477 RepID=A0A433T9D1_ELYCH|nr:hypothetical protein EGW08_014044 [Elysia chlorotica]
MTTSSKDKSDTGSTSNTTEVTSPSPNTLSSKMAVDTPTCVLSTSVSSVESSEINVTCCDSDAEEPELSKSPNENKIPAVNDQCCELKVKALESVRHRPGTPMSLVQPVQSPMTPTSRVFHKEKEISYIPQAVLSKRNMPLPTRPYNAPGTPVMPRNLLRLATCDALETSL